MYNRQAYQTSEQDLEELAGKESVNERIEWIRKTASVMNGGVYTISKVANDIGVGPSVLTKLESGFTKNPNLDLLQNLSKYFNVPINVFFNEYYSSPTPFTIFGQNHSSLDAGPLFREAYQVNLAYTISSLNSENPEPLEDVATTLHLTPLEIEEFMKEIEFFVDKLKARKEKWDSQLTALKKLSNNEEEIPYD
ncbi:helix-turn-helix domain-containing protein [Pseudalkalibacillus hwajinpoensis]|uniref:Helix-turn-helix transcriptional regulator n=1 Tax=Guptibacillus hwajinpoensis TaxID=208199 RepID=A0A4V5PXV8_9BACL|nr:helix-turn-helix transcriptional regulator [Pseudalkalibacillus hwajinpoensis]TKD67688.1 helix-turn-helix transcriptional regulator [Pseudalkalibacillus hwajinpoensis]